MSIARRPEESVDAGALTAEMTSISLDQALRDFEVANARVLDLTARLVTTTQALAAAEEELARLRGASAGLEARVEGAEGALAALHASRAVRAARLGSRVVRRLRR